MRKLEPHVRRRFALPSAMTPPAAATNSRSSRRFEEQIERAARVQRSLLPDVSVPVGEFQLATVYRPCECLGGDFYDLAWCPDCALLLVSDVMGHGLEAALITMIVKAAFQEAAADTRDPPALLARMNSRLHRMMPGRTFVAAAVARLDLHGPGIQLANAGLPYPFILHAVDRTVEEVHLDGVPLGLFEGDRSAGYDVRSLSLAPRDVLLIASDGIGTVEREPGHSFEDHRLREVLGEVTGHDGRHIVDRLMAEAVDFGCGRPLLDDINMVTVSRREPVASGRHANALIQPEQERLCRQHVT